MIQILLSNPAPGNLIMEKYGISELDLFRYVQRGDLIPIKFDGDFIPRPDCRTESDLEKLKYKLDGLQHKIRLASYGSKKLLYNSLEDEIPGFDIEKAELAMRFTLSQPITAAMPPGDPGLYKIGVKAAQNFTPITEKEIKILRDYAHHFEPLFKLND